MELTGDLKKQVENAQTKEEVNGILMNAGIELTDDELDKVSGGFEHYVYYGSQCQDGGSHDWIDAGEPESDGFKVYICTKCNHKCERQVKRISVACR